MNDLRARVAYLQGLASGLDISEDSKESRLLKEIINVLTDFAEEVTELQESQDQLEEYVETLDEDLSDLEDEVCDEYECCCDEDDDEEYAEADCPNCGEGVMFDADILEEDDDTNEYYWITFRLAKSF